MARGYFDGAGGTQGAATARGMSIEAGVMKRPPSSLSQAPSKNTWKSSNSLDGNLTSSMKRPPSRVESLKRNALKKSGKKTSGAAIGLAVGGTLSIAKKPGPGKVGPDAPERRGIALKKKFDEISKNWENYKGNSPAQQEIEDKLKKVKEGLKNK